MTCCRGLDYLNECHEIVPSYPAVQNSSTGLNSVHNEKAPRNMFLLADNILIDGVGRGEAKDESPNCNHDNTKDHQSMPAEKEDQH